MATTFYGINASGQAVPVDPLITAILNPPPLCFLAGTRIATARGQVAVEDLIVGDGVVTLSGPLKAVTWIGTGKGFAPNGCRNSVTPVIVRAGALSEGVPYRDLRVTRGHSFHVDNVLIPVEFLINHRSISWDDRGQEVEIFHVELEFHDVLFANGAPAESYRDDGNRWMFRNGNSSWDQPAKEPYAPVLTGGPIVDAAWKRVLDRADPGLTPVVTSDPDLHLIVNGVRVDGIVRPNGVQAFHLTERPVSLHIASRACAPDTLGRVRDPRILGVALRLIILWQGGVPTVIDVGDPLLNEGFHAYEADGGRRWTNGLGKLPASLIEGAGRGCDVELFTTGANQYRLSEESQPPPVLSARG